MKRNTEHVGQSSHAKRRKKLLGPKQRAVANPRNSVCGSAKIRELDWSCWFTNTWDGERFTHLTVRHSRGAYDPNERTFHRVYCRGCEFPRLGLERGKLYWLIDTNNSLSPEHKTESAASRENQKHLSSQPAQQEKQ